jgi:hypothetical protein
MSPFKIVLRFSIGTSHIYMSPVKIILKFYMWPYLIFEISGGQTKHCHGESIKDHVIPQTVRIIFKTNLLEWISPFTHLDIFPSSTYEPYFFSEGIIFFSHNKSVTFQSDFSAKRTGLPIHTINVVASTYHRILVLHQFWVDARHLLSTVMKLIFLYSSSLLAQCFYWCVTVINAEKNLH